MRSRNLHYWTVIVLVLMRLVFGDLGHAVPHTATSPLDTLSSESAPPCPDHASAHEPSALLDEHLANHDAGRHSGGGEDCCMVGCDCPCVHGVAFLSVQALPATVRMEAIRTHEPLTELVDYQPSGLFRPPA